MTIKGPEAYLAYMYVDFWAVFYFFSDLPDFRYVSYKLIGKHFCVFFFRCFFLRFQETTYAKNVGETKASFVSPSTKELQRKLLES